MHPKINKSDTKTIVEYLPLAYVIRKTILIQTYGEYPKYMTPDDEMIARVLHLLPDKKRTLLDSDVQSTKAHTAEYMINNKSVYDILDHICKDTDLYPYVKQHKSTRDGQGKYYAINSRWLGPNHINATTLKAEMALQISTYDGEKKAWNWEKYVAQHVKYHIILGNLMEYGYQGLDPGSNVWYLLNGIRCDKLSTAIAKVRVHPDKYEKDFDTVVTFLSQYINKKAPTLSLKVASVAQTRPANWQKTSATCGTFKGLSWKKYSREKNDSMLMVQHQQLYELKKKAGLIKGKMKTRKQQSFRD